MSGIVTRRLLGSWLHAEEPGNARRRPAWPVVPASSRTVSWLLSRNSERRRRLDRFVDVLSSIPSEALSHA